MNKAMKFCALTVCLAGAMQAAQAQQNPTPIPTIPNQVGNPEITDNGGQGNLRNRYKAAPAKVNDKRQISNKPQNKSNNNMGFDNSHNGAAGVGNGAATINPPSDNNHAATLTQDGENLPPTSKNAPVSNVNSNAAGSNPQGTLLGQPAYGSNAFGTRQ